MSAPSPLIGALAQLKDVEAALARDLAATREAITAIASVLKLPPATARVIGPKHPTAERPRLPPSVDAPTNGEASAIVRSALKSGPMRVHAFAEATQLSRYQIGQLIKTGVVVATGKTAGRRVALPSAAKEEP